MVDQRLELLDLAILVDGVPAGLGSGEQASEPGLFVVLDPEADGVAVDIEQGLQLADGVALTAEQDGVRTASDGEIGVASVGFFKLLSLGFGQLADKSESGHGGSK